MTSADEQGIPQTGEEDPLVLVDDPIVGEAVAEMASGQAGADLPEEKALIAALDKAEPKASAAIDKEDFTGAMAALASLREADRRLLRSCHGQRPRFRQARAAAEPADALPRRGEPRRGFLEDRRLERTNLAVAGLARVLDRGGARANPARAIPSRALRRRGDARHASRSSASRRVDLVAIARSSICAARPRSGRCRSAARERRRGRKSPTGSDPT